MVMRMPGFLRLAEIDKQHFISACRHGLVHITWSQITLRLTRDEFREMAGVLLRANNDPAPSSLCSGHLRIAYRADEDCEIRIGPLALVLSPTEFERFVQMAQEAIHNLDKILDSGAWDREEPDDRYPDDSLEPARRNPFSRN